MNKAEPKTTYLADYKPPPFLIEAVDLEFEIQEDHTLVTSSLKVIKNPQSGKKTGPFYLHGEELELVEIKINEVHLENQHYSLDERGLTILEVPECFTLGAKIKIKPSMNTKLEGLYASKTGLFTQCEAEGFRRITFFPDRPDVMCLFTTTIIADKEKYPTLLSNGNLVEEGVLENGLHWAKWHDPFPKPSYLFALVAAKLEVLESTYETCSGKHAKLAIYVEPGKLRQCEFALEALKAAMRWDEEVFGLELDLDQYMIVAVSDFNMGAMENKGLNIFNTKYVLASPQTATDNDYMLVDRVIAHEYFHNWTGNRVTCRDWFQLSLKEGLTVFRDQQYGGDRYSHAVQRIQEVRQLRSIQFPEDAGPMAHPVRPSSYIEINNFYTATVYEKGAELVRMLHTVLGAQKFRKGIDLYFQRHDGQAVRIEEFLAAMEDASKTELTKFKPWYEQAGTPVLKVTKNHYAEDNSLELTIEQLPPIGQSKDEYQTRLIPIKLGFLDSSGNDLLKRDTKSSDPSTLISFDKTKEIYQFPDIDSDSVPSLLRGFSAPVNLKYEYNLDDLAHLAQHDSDSFNRWEAFQELMKQTLLSAVKSIQLKQEVVFSPKIKDILQDILEHSQKDRAFAAEMMVLPTASYIAEQTKTYDPQAIFLARLKLRTFVSDSLSNEMELVLQQSKLDKPDDLSAESASKRALKNTCLGFLMELQKEEIFEIALNQLRDSTNMTDEIASLSSLANFNCPQREVAISHFYEKWKNEELVLDKWFVVQALSRLPNTLANVQSLIEHKDFNLQNPNKVRSLIGAFCHGNHHLFHSTDGSGYKFCAEQIIKLDSINPQIAARLARSFDSWSRIEGNARKKAENALRSIKDFKELSTDTLEIVNRALGSALP